MTPVQSVLWAFGYKTNIKGLPPAGILLTLLESNENALVMQRSKVLDPIGLPPAVRKIVFESLGDQVVKAYLNNLYVQDGEHPIVNCYYLACGYLDVFGQGHGMMYRYLPKGDATGAGILWYDENGTLVSRGPVRP